MISLEKSVSTWQFPVNKVIKFGPCWEAPYLWLVTYWQWHYRISWENGGRITKTPALIAGTPFSFPSFVLFSLPLSLPFLPLPRRLMLAVKLLGEVTPLGDDVKPLVSSSSSLHINWQGTLKRNKNHNTVGKCSTRGEIIYIEWSDCKVHLYLLTPYLAFLFPPNSAIRC